MRRGVDEINRATFLTLSRLGFLVCAVFGKLDYKNSSPIYDGVGPAREQIYL
jgi:hypothetical protein